MKPADVVFLNPTPSYEWLPYSIQSLEKLGYTRFFCVSSATSLPAETNQFTHIRASGLADVAPARRQSALLTQLCTVLKGPLLFVDDPVFVVGPYTQKELGSPPASTTLDRECVPCVLQRRPGLQRTIDVLRAKGRTLYEFDNGMPWLVDADELLNTARAYPGTELKSLHLNLLGNTPTQWTKRAKLYHVGHVKSTDAIASYVGPSPVLLASWRTLSPPLFAYLHKRGLDGTTVSLGAQ